MTLQLLFSQAANAGVLQVSDIAVLCKCIGAVALGVPESKPDSVFVPMHAKFIHIKFSNKGQLLSGKFSHYRKQPGGMSMLSAQSSNHWLLSVNVVLQEPALGSAWSSSHLTQVCPQSTSRVQVTELIKSEGKCSAHALALDEAECPNSP